MDKMSLHQKKINLHLPLGTVTWVFLVGWKEGLTSQPLDCWNLISTWVSNGQVICCWNIVIFCYWNESRQYVSLLFVTIWQNYYILPPTIAFVNTAFERYRRDPLILKALTFEFGMWDINFLPPVTLLR